MGEATEEMDQKEFFESFEPDVKPKLLKRTYVDYIYLRELKDSDFDLGSLTFINFRESEKPGIGPVRLNIERPHFVLFVKQDPESQRFLRMWLRITEGIKNEYCQMCYCNLDFEREIGKKFVELSQRKYISHPFYWARYVSVPFALVYRDGWPQGFYNGGFFFQDLINFAMTVVPDSTVEVDRFQKNRPAYMDALRRRELELMNELEDERQKEDEVKEKVKLREMDTREQIIAHAVGFD